MKRTAANVSSSTRDTPNLQGPCAQHRIVSLPWFRKRVGAVQHRRERFIFIHERPRYVRGSRIEWSVTSNTSAGATLICVEVLAGIKLAERPWRFGSQHV